MDGGVADTYNQTPGYTHRPLIGRRWGRGNHLSAAAVQHHAFPPTLSGSKDNAFQVGVRHSFPFIVRKAGLVGSLAVLVCFARGVARARHLLGIGARATGGRGREFVLTGGGGKAAPPARTAGIFR